MTSTKFFDAFSLVVTRGHSWSTRGHSWSLVVIRGHSWSLVCTFRHDLQLGAETQIKDVSLFLKIDTIVGNYEKGT